MDFISLVNGSSLYIFVAFPLKQSSIVAVFSSRLCHMSLTFIVRIIKYNFIECRLVLNLTGNINSGRLPILSASLYASFR